MAELTISQLIKIILGILVVVAVVIGVGLFIKNYVVDYFKNLPELILGLVK
ncbi:MAG: hypothetical protein PVJ67_05345 [Candidatus Pacearchaeota archaeon]|jgi:hypothetical protein